jgi:ribosomal protein L7Ae-like RNA K-turn-binding protein
VKSPREADTLGLLGLAHRAGAVLTGVGRTRKGIDGGEVALALLARDASKGQLEKVMGILRHRDVPVRWISKQVVLGAAVGQGALSAVGVVDRSFAEQLLKRLPEPPKGSEDWKREQSQEESGRDAGC